MRCKVVHHLPSGADEKEDELFYSESEAHDAAREGFPIIERAQRKTIC